MAMLNLTLNGTATTVDVRENEYLAEVLRYRLGLTGTKIGCNEAECGICTVLVNGTPVDSCIYPALKADGAAVMTIEGLGPAWKDEGGRMKDEVLPSSTKLHPLQEAFARGGAPQCGFCIPGLIMTAKGLIDEKPEPTEHDIKVALKDTYCRCAGYSFIVNAIQAAARTVRTGEPLPEALVALPDTKAPLKVIGQPLPRPDVVGKVTGGAKYTDD